MGLVYNDLNGNGVQNGSETGLGGVEVYLDVNNNGVQDANEASTITDPTGQFRFSGLAAGTYIVREVTPAGNSETQPTASAVATTVFFDGTGSESGITGAGVSSFTYQGAGFSGGTIFTPATGQGALLASGTRWRITRTPTPAKRWIFSHPVSTAKFFYVHGFGIRLGNGHGVRGGWLHSGQCDEQVGHHRR